MNNKENENKMNINWYPGHMAKTKRELIEKLKLIDVVVEILDARLPLSSQNPDLKNIIGKRKKVVVLNKSDLADEVENKRWVNYFLKQEITAVLVDSKSGKGVQEVIRQIEKMMLNDQAESEKKGRVGKAIRVMVVGIPNVGKSSFINRFSKKTSAEVGNKPGVTKQTKWIRVSNNIELLDTPGVLWPKFENQDVALNLSYIGTIKDEILEKTEIAFYLLKYLLHENRENLQNRYNLEELEIQKILTENENQNEAIMNIMNGIAVKRGAIASGGKVDEERIAGIIIDDFRTGKLGRISLEKVK